MKEQWDFIPTKEKQDAYENIINDLNICAPEEFISYSKEDQDKILTYMISKIRKINIFPIYYFNEDGIKKEIQSVIDKKVCFTGDSLDLFYSQGLLLLDYLFPNLHHAVAGEIKHNKSIYERFYDDDCLKECLKLAISNRKIVNMRTTFFTYARYLWRSATNYSPLRAKAIYERFCPKNGIIYDYSCGFGGRMLGALSSSNNYIYIGTDPNTETYENLLQLGEKIESVTGREESYMIYNDCSEDLLLKDNLIDFIFSCPPFFNLEKYTDEETQSYNQYKKYEDWLEHYVRPTLKNCYKCLKDTGLYGVDVMNFWLGGKKYKLVNDWIKIAEEEGFFLKGVYEIKTRARKKSEDDKNNIYIFTKNKDIEIPNYTNKDTLAYWKEKISKDENIKNKKVVKYNIFGKYIEECLTVTNEIKEAIKGKTLYNNYYYREIKGNIETPLIIDVKQPLCITDDTYFFTCVDLAKYCGVTKQAAAQSKSRKGRKINGHKIEWFG